MQTATSPSPRDGLIDIDEVVRESSLSRSSIYRGIKAGTFPPAIRVSSGRVAWRTADIAAWAKDPANWRAIPAERSAT
ncbi:helix-turn-helix transcriptional regulator [Sphingobium yanoikuyae]|jgi:prophage regulatory protein